MHPQKLGIVYRNHPLQIDYFCRRGVKGTLVYLHGLGCSKSDFTGALTCDDLRGYTLIAFDFPGCGNSSYPANQRFGIDDLVEITHVVLSALETDNFVIIGHSMGGLVALLYTERYGEYVKGFINVEGNVAPEDCFFSRDVAQHDFTHLTTTLIPTIKQNLVQSTNTGYRKYAETLGHASTKAFFDCCPSLVEYSDYGNLLQRYIGLEISKLFVYGSENCTLSYLPALHDSGCDIIEIPKSNHFAMYDNPQAFYRAIAAFLQK